MTIIGNSIVILGINKISKEKFAIKIFEKKKFKKNDELVIKDEAKLLSDLNHPNIVKYIEIIEDTNNVYLILEYLEGGELYNKIVKKSCLSEKEAKEIAKCLFSAVKYCHDRKIMHRLLLENT